MELTDHITVNMLKSQLLDIYEKYTAKPELLSDPNVRSAYTLLKKAATIDELFQWQVALHNLGLDFTSMDGLDWQDNLMGILEDTINGASDEVLDEFLLWKRAITPEAWQHSRKCSAETVRLIEDAVRNRYNAHIVLFKCGNAYAAIGPDADRLFLLFGWQTGYVSDGKDYVSWMYVSGYGMKVLESSKYTVKVLDLGKLDIVSTAFQEDLLSAIQQYSAYVQTFIVKNEKIYKALEKDVPVILRHCGYNEEVKAKGIVIPDGRTATGIKPLANIAFSDSHGIDITGLFRLAIGEA